ncbi:ATP-binding protein [Alteraurantiacibacter aquimixticola]|uniref:ATP-binding protein n=1 Tax=Alteraurantiacibacter aquimixticola TaxID=2489173 RepID=A0A4T3EWQ5_9SPHN|nr:ATP-binding protein [Alteraurantiacibacter aquimixticola]TIX48913.1 ATP-binding protein [Alteraurantiacibacter aquimixticola]
MRAQIEIGRDSGGQPVMIDVEELLATRLLVQGNSGSGKSHLLRRLLEESAGLVQQVVIDPEGDFVSLADHFGHIVIDGGSYTQREIEALAARIRQHRASVVLSLDDLEVEQQIRCAAQFLTALFDAPREHWYPALVAVDEAQMFAPSAAGEIAEDTRRMTLSAMTNLMCRGRKRGLAGIVATQRLAKLAKNVAAEASNFLMGRTFLDIDMQRAADLLGMDRKQAERIRDLERGHFLGLGPAISRRPVAVKIGSVKTGGKNASAGLMPLPTAAADEMEALLHASLKEEAAEPAPPRPAPVAKPPVQELEETIAEKAERADRPAGTSPQAPAEDAGGVESILAEMAQEEGATFQPAANLFRNFAIRCRERGVASAHIDMTEFKRLFAIASAGLERLDEAQRAAVEQLAEGVADDVLAPYLAIAAAAAEGRTAPDEDELARVYGTSSPGRIRRLLDHLEKTGLIVVREDFGGERSISVPGLEEFAS